MSKKRKVFYTARRILKEDPAARNILEVIFLYPGYKVLYTHAIAHFLYKIKLRFLARLFSNIGRFYMELKYPGAKSVKVWLLITVWVLLLETAVIGDDCKIYHQVTLGELVKKKALKDIRPRHNVIKAGAKLLGDITIGDNSKIGANAVVLKDCPPNSTLVGIPARIINKELQNNKDDIIVKK